MRKTTMTLMAALLAAPMWAQVTPLGGFYYGQMPAPTGWEWQSPDSVAYNKQQPHAWFFSFENVEQARKVLPENSALWQSLDGQWQFHWAKIPTNAQRTFTRQTSTPRHGTKYKCPCRGTWPANKPTAPLSMVNPSTQTSASYSSTKCDRATGRVG